MLHRPTKFWLFQKMSHATDVLCVLLNCFYLTICTPKEKKMDAICFVFLRCLYKYAILQNNQNCYSLVFFNAFYSQFAVLQVQNL